MSTEYRRGIPGTAHVEAATRLGLLWEDTIRMRFTCACLLEAQVLPNASFRPILPDGTPVDWEVLDQEVARVGQQQQLIGRDDGSQFAINTDGSRSPLSVQPQGFRADLWVRLNEWITANWLNTLGDIEAINDRGISSRSRRYSWDTLGLDTQTDEADRQALIARWTVYQELKPLYDLVDGAQGEAAMPRDVVTEWARQARGGENIRPDWALVRTAKGLLGRTTNQQGGIISWSDAENWLGQPLRNFAAVLDAVAERWVAERMRGQTQAPTIPSAQPEPLRNFAAVLDAVAERWVAERMRGQTPTVASTQPEPRRFADVRPDRHGWRWWRVYGRGEDGTVIENQNGQFRWHARQITDWMIWEVTVDPWFDRTVIPTDEQGNPVSWESIGPTDPTEIRLTSAPGTPDRHGTRRAAPEGFFSTEPPTPPRPGQFSNNLATTPLTPETEQHGVPGIHITVGTGAKPSVPAQSIEAPAPTPSRFALIELDDADPTAERIRLEQEAERQRLAELRQRLATERAAQLQKMAKESEVSRFDLIEPDPQADPAASIRAWEARQAAAKVRHTAAPSRIAKPAAALRRPAIEVVDAEADGLSRVEIVTALFGRALNGGC